MYALPEVLEGQLIIHEGLISSIKLYPEVLHAVLLTPFAHIMWFLALSLHCDNHGHPSEVFQLLGGSLGRSVPEH